jgi:colanic acid/amylovoran biosynthesis protein
MKDPIIKVLIAEEIPSLNKGEAAILKGILASFKRIKNRVIKVSMVSFNPKTDSARYKNINVIPFPIKNLIGESKLIILIKGLLFIFEYTFFCLYYYLSRGKKAHFYKNLIWDEYIHSNIIIFGHDALLENFGNQKFSFNRYLTFISTYYSIILAKVLLKQKVIIYGGGIGKYKCKFIEYICTIALKMVDLITIRDRFSYRYLFNLGIKNNMYLTADLAFLMNSVSQYTTNKIFKKENISTKNKILVGMTVSKELYLFTNKEIVDKEIKYSKYIELKASVVDYLVEKYNANILFIPHALKKNKDDRLVARAIYKNIKHQHNVKLIENEYSPEELKGIISQCDYFIGERTHSNVAAVSSYVPTICVSEPKSHRNRGIFENIIDKKLICDVSKMTLDVYKKKIDYLFKNNDKIRNKLLVKIKENRKKALTNGFLFENILNKR